MIVRVSKRILRDILSTATLPQVAECVSHFFNCLLGTLYNSAPEAIVADGLAPTPAYAKLTPSSLADQIRFEVLRRFRYTLPDDYVSSIKRLPALREICLRVGLQVEARDYQFAPSATEEEDEVIEEPKETSKKKDKKKLQATKQKQPKRANTFVPDDVLNLLPTVKQATTRVSNTMPHFPLTAEEVTCPIMFDVTIIFRVSLPRKPLRLVK